MSEETPPPAEIKKIKLGPKRKFALLTVIERKRLSDRVDFAAIGARHGMSAGSLRVLWHQWIKGKVDLGMPETPEEKVIDARVLHQKTLELIRRYKALVVYGLEKLLARAEDYASKNKGFDLSKSGLPQVRKELAGIMDLQDKAERGYIALLDDVMAAKQRAEKHIGSNITETSTKLIGASEEQRAIEALSGPMPPESAENGA